VQGGTVCGTADAQKPPLDPQLQLLIERWPTLSKAVQQQTAQPCMTVINGSCS
jgi:hypothetical protein